MNDYEVQFSRFLENRNLKLTSPRKHILEAVFSIHEHFNAEELYTRIKAITPGISLATVYRTIPLLMEAGLVQHAIRSSGRDRYEHIFGHPKHIHWVCRKCGVVIETDQSSLLPVLESKAEGLRFKLEEMELNLKGLCWKCATAENENHIDEK